MDIPSSNAEWWIKNQSIPQNKNYNNISNNLFTILALKELSKNTILSAVKPWQAPDHNYLFVKIPPKLEFNGKKLYEYHFQSQDESLSWHRVDGFAGSGNNLDFDQLEGHTKLSSLHLRGTKTLYPVIRFISPPFPIKVGFGYKVQAWVKSSPVLQSEPNGFLRIDFYQNLPQKWNEETRSLSSSLSERYLSGSGWKNLEVAAVADSQANFATVSFQISPLFSNDFWIDDINISESERKIFLLQDPGVYEQQFHEELLPYSIGNM